MDYTRIKELLLAARDLSPDERAAFLDEACGDDRELRREVESLLAHEDDAPSVVRTGGLARELPAALGEDAPLPERMGPYRILEVIGRGGMGVVYRAEQTEPFRREVALKHIRKGFDSERVVARFEAERRTLARMEHPNIATLLDAGADDEGRPYFVMELVRGEPITDYCNAHDLSVADRLALFLAVGQAVQHAHQRGIIHRDLKPSNILVPETDGAPVPKIIDFGIAKAVEDPLDGRALLTQEGNLIGTPEYMSPEQAGVTEYPVDTRTDVYSLGVLLYELLTGRRPHRFETYTPAEIRRVLGEHEPERPSTAVTHAQDMGGTEDAGRAPRSRHDTTRLRRRLAGDLDTIVLMALRREPDRRYSSVEQLVEDVRRHLAGLPVRARKDTWSYRTGKFVRRHRVGVGLAAVIAVALVGVGAVSAVQSARVARERDRAVAAEAMARQEADRAGREAETSQQVSDFLVDLFAVSDPGNSEGETVTARELLDRGAERIGTELADQPEVRATLMRSMSEAYLGIGTMDRAGDLADSSLALRERAYGPDNLDTAMARHLLAIIRIEQGRYEEADSLLVAALAVLRTDPDAHPKDLASALDYRAVLLYEEGRYDESEELLREQLEVNRTLPRDDSNMANNLAGLSGILMARGKFADAEPLLQEALDLTMENRGPDNPDMASAYNNLAYVQHALGKVDEAEASYRASLGVYTRIQMGEHPRVAQTMGNLAMVLNSRGKYAEAVDLLEQSLQMQKHTLGADHPSVGITLNNLGINLAPLGRYAEAEDYLRRALKLRMDVEGPEHPNTAHSMNVLGALLVDLGQVDEGEQLIRGALALRKKIFGDEHPDVAISMGELAKARLARGDGDEALRLAREAVAMQVKLQGADHPETADAEMVLGRALAETGDRDQAEQVFRHALETRRAAYHEDNPRLAEAKMELGSCLAAGGRFAEAESLMAGACDVLSARLGKNCLDLKRARRQMTGLYEAWGKEDRASAYRDPAPGDGR